MRQRTECKPTSVKPVQCCFPRPAEREYDRLFAAANSFALVKGPVRFSATIQSNKDSGKSGPCGLVYTNKLGSYSSPPSHFKTVIDVRKTLRLSGLPMGYVVFNLFCRSHIHI